MRVEPDCECGLDAYRDLGGDYFDRLHPERTKQRLLRRLARLGLKVTAEPIVNTGPQKA